MNEIQVQLNSEEEKIVGKPVINDMGDLWILAYNKKFDKRSFESGYRAGVQQMLDMIEMFEEEDNI